MHPQMRPAEAASPQTQTPMDTRIPTPPTGAAHTEALRRALRAIRDETSAADLIFLENWELSSIPGVAAALRASQIRRANPALVAEIRAELTAAKRRPA